jgi:hypothetical protein
MEEKPDNPGTEDTPIKEDILPANKEQDITSSSQPDATIANQLVADIPVQPAATGFTPPAVSMSQEEYAYLLQLKHEHRELLIEKRVAELGSEYTTRRNTLIVRRAIKLHPDLVSKVEVLAYHDIYKLKESAASGEGKKHPVTDEEISAFIAIDTEGITPTLALVKDRVTQNQASV